MESLMLSEEDRKIIVASFKTCITIEEAKLLASVSKEQIQEWAKCYDFPSMKIGKLGGKRLISKKAFDEWCNNRCKLRHGERI